MAYITNRKAKHDFNFKETMSAGMELLGTEVKSIKDGKASIVGSKILVRGGEAYLVGASIPLYQEKNFHGEYDKERSRRLLLSKKEINHLFRLSKERFAFIPISIYNRNGYLKLEIGLGEKRNLRDKREKLKEKDQKRRIKEDC